MNEERPDFREAAARQHLIHLIEKLGELHKAGILTEEFTTKKQELLSRI